MTRRLRVVYWNNQPSPYVVDRFNAVADHGVLDFEAWFDTMREADRSWDVDPDRWTFRARVLGTTDADRPLDRVPVDLIERTRPDVLIANYDRLHMVLGLLAARGLAGRVAVRCLPTWPSWETPSGVRTLARHLLFRGVDGAKVPGPDGAAYAASHGLPPARSWPVTQSIDVAHYAKARAIAADDRTRLRRRWGATGCAFVYVGRLWHGKGVFGLIDAFRRVRAALPDASLLLVGDGSDEPSLREHARGLDGVSWVGFVQPRDLPQVYGAADVLVFPTLGDPNGLVVEEAMAAGLPIVTTSAAGDIRRRVPEGRAGYVVPPDDVQALARAMIGLGGDPGRRRAFGEVAARLTRSVTPERYALDFERFVHALTERPARRGAVPAAFGLGGPAVRSLVRRRPARVGSGSSPTTVTAGDRGTDGVVTD